MTAQIIWSADELLEFERLYRSKSEPELLRLFPGKTVGQIRGKAIKLQLSRPALGEAYTLAPDHPAVVNGETLFPTRVRSARGAHRLLVPGYDQRKLGGRVARPGAWHGFPIYSLTLEERETCPTYCHHWLTCMGNAMHMAVRIDARDPSFLTELDFELEGLQARHPGGFVVRLHVLGDFYSIGYVAAWEAWLDALPALHVFGYTARDPQQKSDIGAVVLDLASRRWDRFAVRLSSVEPGPRRAITAFDPRPPAMPDVITCPAETLHPDGTKATKGCNTCGLCWRAPDKTIRFIAHGGGRRGRKAKQ